MNPIEWLEANAWGFRALPQADRDAIMHFLFLWSLLEAEVFCTRASARCIEAKSRQWESEGRLKPESFSDCFGYFQKRYFENGKFTQHFWGLNFRSNDNQQLVEVVLKGENKSIGDTLAALLIIVYRLRNNLFHGGKWADELRVTGPKFCTNPCERSYITTWGCETGFQTVV